MCIKSKLFKLLRSGVWGWRESSSFSSRCQRGVLCSGVWGEENFYLITLPERRVALWNVGWRESSFSSRSQRGVLCSGMWGGENLLSHHAAREACCALGCGVERLFFLITVLSHYEAGCGEDVPVEVHVGEHRHN